MPVFEYRCETCEAVHEEIVLPGEQTPDACPACGGDLRRLWSRVGVQFVGWGFSKTDSLIPDDRGPRSDFKKLREKASELFD